MVSTLESIDRVHQVRRVVSCRTNGPSRVAAVGKVDVRSAPGASEIMRSDRRTAAVGTAQVSEASPVKNKSEDLIASVVRRGVVIRRVADDMVNEKANVLVAKEEGNDLAASLANHVKGVSHVNPASPAKASLTVALATRVAHQDQDGKIEIDAAEVEVEAPETMDESEFVILRTSRMAT